MKNIIFKFVSVLTMFMGMTHCSLDLDEEGFLRSMTGKYTLTGPGKNFIIRELKGYVTDPVEEEVTVLEMRGDGSLNIIFTPATATTPPVEQKIAQFIRLELEDQGLYRLKGVNTYVAMGKSGILLTSTFDGEFNENDVFFESHVPIAKEKAE